MHNTAERRQIEQAQCFIFLKRFHVIGGFMVLQEWCRVISLKEVRVDKILEGAVAPWFDSRKKLY